MVGDEDGETEIRSRCLTISYYTNNQNISGSINKNITTPHTIIQDSSQFSQTLSPYKRNPLIPQPPLSPLVQCENNLNINNLSTVSTQQGQKSRSRLPSSSTINFLDNVRSITIVFSRDETKEIWHKLIGEKWRVSFKIRDSINVTQQIDRIYAQILLLNQTAEVGFSKEITISR